MKEPSWEKRGPLAIIHSDGSNSPLDSERRRFCEEFLVGEHAQNATRALMAVRPDLDYDSASVRASHLLKEDRVQEFLATLRERAVLESSVRCNGRLIPWMELLPTAQQIVVAVAEGKLRSRLQLDAAKYVIDRCLGTPVQQTQVTTRDEGAILKALGAFAERVATERKQRVVK